MSRPQSRQGSRSPKSQSPKPDPPPPPSERDHRKEKLKRTAQETLSHLDPILASLKTRAEAEKVSKHTLTTLPRLSLNACPYYKNPAKIKVVNQDTFEASRELLALRADTGARPAVVNFANRYTPGGGWLNGSMAQEEELCYRSSLSLSLNPKQYPLGTNDALYSPYVLVIREPLAKDHAFLHTAPGIRYDDLPVVSVLTVAAIHRPEIVSYQVTKRARVAGQAGTGVRTPLGMPVEKKTFALDRERNLTKDKMRLVLRIAASHGHRSIVLGALGCGVFMNPPEDVAQCWYEVLSEDEFTGGGSWWRDVVFAVYDRNDEGNYAVFKAILDGVEV